MYISLFDIFLLVLILIATFLSMFIYHNLKKRIAMLQKLIAEKNALSKKYTLQRRRRKRYIVFSTIGDDEISTFEIEKGIKNSFSELFGEVVASYANPRLILYREDVKKGIIGVSKDYLSHCLLSMQFIDKKTNKKIKLFPLKVAGTIRKAREILFEDI